MAARPLPRCVMLWIGDRLGPVERACIRSVLAQGHDVRLYRYGVLDGVPEGVELADAASILPEDAIVRHRSGSAALFSDRFRFELLRRGAGLWLDLDVYLLAPLPMPGDGHMFGWCETDLLGAGVLALPPDSPLIAPVLRLFEQPYVPDWLPVRERLVAHARRLRTGRVDPGRLPWGVAGPLALTALAKRHHLLAKAMPRHVLYPYGWRDAACVFGPEEAVEAVVEPGTVALHLYGHMLAARADEPAPPGSFIARIRREGA